MAFNFNWSPLIADTSRAREMLTAALNKSPKPPIIVDDILVNELNLGSVPPELDILEIGDLAEDRFRGIFKMSYAGDAFLTLKTRVQANPLNTYLSTKPTFASPQPLAAASGLTIPLQITLSDIRLSGFVILVFSRQKGITLVFRNDPLESLKVSSTFDSIPFVRDYLQKEIEGQLRVLFMEDLPAIIHRLSLRLWVPEYSSPEMDAMDNAAEDNKELKDPFTTAPQNPISDIAAQLTESDVPPFFFDQGEGSSTYSQRIVLRLAALTDSYRTLSLFTPPIGDAVFRAWAGAAEHGQPPSAPVTSFTLGSLARKHSSAASISSLHSFSDGGDSRYTLSSRPTLSNLGSASMGSTKSRTHGRKRKKRVVNLRKAKTTDDIQETASRPSTPTSTSYASQSGPASEVREGELVTPPASPERNEEQTVLAAQTIDSRMNTPLPKKALFTDLDPPSHDEICQEPLEINTSASPQSDPTPRPPLRRSHPEKASSSSPSHYRSPVFSPNQVPQTGGILEQAWMIKMASEIARKVESEKAAGSGLWHSDDHDENPPPAYAA